MRLLFAIDGFVYFSWAIAFCGCLGTGVSDQMDWGFFLWGACPHAPATRKQAPREAEPRAANVRQAIAGLCLRRWHDAGKALGALPSAGKALLQVFFAVFVAQQRPWWGWP